ncbi:MAG: hypothetical protein ACK41C_13100 [Phenylobacterium sp.]|uniref:hypothetical protein n=1 Tax=Phenylobacterium sp. TaxID=1871053 RepID=UPI00391BD80D
MSPRAQAILARLFCLAAFAGGLGLTAWRLVVGVAAGTMPGLALHDYDLEDDPLGFALAAGAWTAAALFCFVASAAFLSSLLARPRAERRPERKPSP